MTQQNDRLPSQSLLAAILQFIDEVNSGQAEAALAHFTDDVVIIEDLPPYRLDPPGAGMRWLQMMGANAQKLGVTGVILHPAAAPRRIEADETTGYCILPGELTLDGPGKHMTASGELTMAARFEGGAWKFCAMTWAGGEPA